MEYAFSVVVKWLTLLFDGPFHWVMCPFLLGVTLPHLFLTPLFLRSMLALACIMVIGLNSHHRSGRLPGIQCMLRGLVCWSHLIVFSSFLHIHIKGLCSHWLIDQS